MMYFRKNLVLPLLLSTGLIAGVFSTLNAEEAPQGSVSKTPEYDAEGEQANIAIQAANVIAKHLEQEEAKRAPESVREAAQCIGVFPNVIEFGFIVAGKGGPGIVSCRDEESGEWGAPAIYKLSAGSVGLQAGVQSAAIILVYLQDEAVESLKKSKMSFGGGINLQAGPVGVDADTDALKKAAVVSYVRSKGLFAGVNLEGASVSFIESRNAKLYGEEVTAEQVLFGEKEIPKSAKAFTDMLTKLAPPKQ